MFESETTPEKLLDEIIALSPGLILSPKELVEPVSVWTENEMKKAKKMLQEMLNVEEKVKNLESFHCPDLFYQQASGFINQVEMNMFNDESNCQLVWPPVKFELKDLAKVEVEDEVNLMAMFEEVNEGFVAFDENIRHQVFKFVEEILIHDVVPNVINEIEMRRRREKRQEMKAMECLKKSEDEMMKDYWISQMDIIREELSYEPNQTFPINKHSTNEKPKNDFFEKNLSDDNHEMSFSFAPINDTIDCFNASGILPKSFFPTCPQTPSHVETKNDPFQKLSGSENDEKSGHFLSNFFRKPKEQFPSKVQIDNKFEAFNNINDFFNAPNSAFRSSARKTERSSLDSFPNLFLREESPKSEENEFSRPIKFDSVKGFHYPGSNGDKFQTSTPKPNLLSLKTPKSPELSSPLHDSDFDSVSHRQIESTPKWETPRFDDLRLSSNKVNHIYYLEFGRYFSYICLSLSIFLNFSYLLKRKILNLMLQNFLSFL